MPGPRFTVVTPVLNGSEYLEQALSSIQSQSYSNWQHVLVDGDSTDSTLSIAKEFQRRDSRFSILSGPDRGMYDALLKGFDSGTGDLCCWLNADDRLHPWALEVVAEYYQKTGAQWFTGIPTGWDKEGRLHRVGDMPWFPQLLIRKGLFHGRALGFIQQESTMFTRALYSRLSDIQRGRLRSSRLAGDFLLWTYFAEHASLKVLPTIVGGFRSHSGNASKTSGGSGYYREIAEAGFPIPPPELMRLSRIVHSLGAFLVNRGFRRRQYDRETTGSTISRR